MLYWGKTKITNHVIIQRISALILPKMYEESAFVCLRVASKTLDCLMKFYAWLGGAFSS